jgi:predicted ribosome quality control (RQC) complex YloA/Tae2 family protein
MDFSIEKIIDALEKDVKSRKRLAELIVIEPDIRLAIINAIIRDVATKSDIEKLRIETKEDIEKLRSEFRNEMHQFRNELNQFRSELNQLRSEVHSNFRWIVGLIFGMWTSMMVCLIPILLKLLV